MRRFCQVIHAREDLQSRELIGLHGGFHARKELAEQLERAQIGDAGLGGFTVFIADFTCR